MPREARLVTTEDGHQVAYSLDLERGCATIAIEPCNGLSTEGATCHATERDSMTQRGPFWNEFTNGPLGDPAAPRGRTG